MIKGNLSLLTLCEDLLKYFLSGIDPRVPLTDKSSTSVISTFNSSGVSAIFALRALSSCGVKLSRAGALLFIRSLIKA